MNGRHNHPLPLPPLALKCASWGETGKMLTNFIFNLPFCRRACRSGIASSEISSPLSWKHIGAEFASCRPPLPSAAIILRPHPALWPAILPGTGPVQNQKVALFNSGHRHTSPNCNLTSHPQPLGPRPPPIYHPCIHPRRFRIMRSMFVATVHIIHKAGLWLSNS